MISYLINKLVRYFLLFFIFKILMLEIIPFSIKNDSFLYFLINKLVSFSQLFLAFKIRVLEIISFISKKDSLLNNK